MFLSVWFQACFLTLLLNEVRHDMVTCLAQRSPQISEDRTAAGTRCGEGLCRCSDDGREAQCLDLTREVKRLPRLPQSVRVLKLGFDECFFNLTNDIFFHNTPHITCLHLLRSTIHNLNNRSFVWATNLTSLHIGADFIPHKDKRAQKRLNLVIPLFTIPTLRFLNASGFYLDRMPRKAFHTIKNSHIEILHFERNVNGGVLLKEFEAFKRLKQFYLSFNNISNLKSDRVFKFQELYLDHNRLAAFPKTCVGKESYYPELEVLDLSNNAIANCLDKVCLPRLKTLWLDFNAMEVIPADFFNDTRFPSLTELHMDKFCSFGTLHVLRVPRCAFCNKNLNFLSLASNNFDFARATQVDIRAFAELPRLHTLLLDNNNFERVNGSLFLQLFGGLSSLRELSLSNCHFATFTRLTFAIFPNLATLILNNNGIMEMPDGIFEPLPKLHVLDLSKNRFITVSEGLFRPQTRQNLKRLSLNDNRLMCTCDLMWFSKWMANDPGVFGYPNTTYDCRNLPGTTVPEYSVQEQACLLGREINVLLIFSTSLVIVTLTVFSLVFRYRWHVRMLLYEVFRGRDNIRRHRLLADHFDYDVFVSYASEDLPWIRQHLMPELETNLGLRLCVHERDFIPGKNIAENIADCVQSSKKILVVYSNDFVRSQWCQFELMFCLRHVMDYDDALIIVCVDDVTSRRMTSAMMAVLKTTTYIQWAEQEDAVHSFWGRLRLALHEVTDQVAHV